MAPCVPPKSGLVGWWDPDPKQETRPWHWFAGVFLSFSKQSARLFTTDSNPPVPCLSSSPRLPSVSSVLANRWQTSAAEFPKVPWEVFLHERVCAEAVNVRLWSRAYLHLHPQLLLPELPVRQPTTRQRTSVHPHSVLPSTFCVGVGLIEFGGKVGLTNKNLAPSPAVTHSCALCAHKQHTRPIGGVQLTQNTATKWTLFTFPWNKSVRMFLVSILITEINLNSCLTDPINNQHFGFTHKPTWTCWVWATAADVFIYNVHHISINVTLYTSTRSQLLPLHEGFGGLLVRLRKLLYSEHLHSADRYTAIPSSHVIPKQNTMLQLYWEDT